MANNKHIGRTNRSNRFNKEELLKLCMMQCTTGEIAGWFGCCERTIERLKKNPAYAEIFIRGKESGKAALRRIQFNMAQRSPAMAIFLGKQYLGQKDIVEQQNTGETKIKVTYNLDDHVPTNRDPVPEAETVSQTGNGHFQPSALLPDRGVH